MKIVEMAELKQQMRVDFDEEDDVIALYGSAAENAIVNESERTLDDLCRMGYKEQTGAEAAADIEVGVEYFPRSLRLAVLMLAAHFYRNREPVASVNQVVVPYAYEVLCKPYKKLTERRM